MAGPKRRFSRRKTEPMPVMRIRPGVIRGVLWIDAVIWVPNKAFVQAG
jgi:hypothetical protein